MRAWILLLAVGCGGPAGGAPDARAIDASAPADDAPPGADAPATADAAAAADAPGADAAPPAAAWAAIGPFGGDVGGLVQHPSNFDILYAASGGGSVWKTTDGGSSWRELDLPDVGYWSIALDPAAPETVLVAGQGGVVRRSIDGGAHWTEESLPAGFFGVTDLEIGPGGVAYAVASFGGVARSTATGEPWTQLLDIGGARTIAIDPVTPTTLYLGRDAIHGGAKLRKSIDGGAEWTEAATGLPDGVLALAIDPTAPATLYAGTESMGVYRSIDGGGEWTHAGPPDVSAPLLGVDALLVVPPLLYARDELGLYRSGDGGDSWTNLGLGADPLHALAVHTLLREPGGRIWAAIGHVSSPQPGVIVSDDGGVSWSPVNAGMTATAVDGVFPLATAPERIFVAGGDLDVGDLFTTHDGGDTWAVVPELRDRHVTRVLAHPTDARIGFACAVGFFKSDDGFATWREIGIDPFSSSADALEDCVIDPADADTIYVATRSIGVRRSRDAGETWEYAGLGAILYVRGLTFDPTRPGRLWAATDDGVFFTEDGGDLWTPTARTTMTREILVRSDGVLVAIGGGGVSVSTDGGDVWMQTLDEPVVAAAIDPTDGARMYAGTVGGGLWSSSSGGTGWAPVLDFPLPTASIWDVAVDAAGVVYATTGGHGVLRRP